MTDKAVDIDVTGLGSIVLLVDGIVVKTLEAKDGQPFRFDHEGIAFERFVANSDGASYYRPAEPLTDAQRKTLAALLAKAKEPIAEPKAEPKHEPKHDTRYGSKS